MILCLSQNNVVTTVYDIFHLDISYHSSSSIYVDLIAPVANVICYYTTSTINKYFLSYHWISNGLLLSHINPLDICFVSTVGRNFLMKQEQSEGLQSLAGCISHVYKLYI